MSTHNIGFYEEIIKIIPYLSSNIIKYASYLIFCVTLLKLMKLFNCEVISMIIIFISHML